MKNKILKVVTGALSVLCLAACSNNVSKTDEKSFPGVGYQENDYLAITNLNHSLKIGEKVNIEIYALPNNNKAKDVTFTSSEPTVASVSETGEVNALKKGLSVISVNRLDGSLLGKVNVLVTNQDDTDVASTIAAYNAVYDDAGFKEVTKGHVREYSYEKYFKDGKLDHSYESYEDLCVDKSKLYFSVSSNDLYTYTREGNRSLNGGKWIFQVQGLKARMIHITDTVKNYFDFNSADEKYESDKMQIIYDILDLFFVSGADIATNVFKEMSGKEYFQHYAKFIGQSGVNFYADGNNNLAMNIEFLGETGTVTTDEELNVYDIYEGTSYTEDYYEHYIYSNAKCVGMNVNADLKYKENGVDCSRAFSRSMAFEESFVVEEYKANDKDMQKDGWKRVDSIYDL